MRVGLFVPCYVDQLFPRVGLATVNLLRRLGCEVEFPTAQTCCGQPMANTGVVSAAAPLARDYLRIFEPYDYIVCPSGSCVSMVRHHYADVLDEPSDSAHGDSAHDEARHDDARGRTYELCEFLVDVLKVNELDVRFPHRVGIHQSCHGLRELRLGSSSERVGPTYSKIRQLLELVSDIEFTDLTRSDECCGFGGTFAVAEEGVSCLMGRDRIEDHLRAGSEVITGNDMSCLMHLDGLLRRDGKAIRVLHVAEILAG
ncbi:MAG: (Fe-S)-binding protein [Planctomycetales bacterium]|nr:(Fe-S)-binding protein [Planctomycetales bacterium]